MSKRDIKIIYNALEDLGIAASTLEDEGYSNETISANSALIRLVNEADDLRKALEMIADQRFDQGPAVIASNAVALARDALLRAGEGDKWDRVAAWERRNGITANVTIKDEAGDKLWPAPKLEVRSCETCYDKLTHADSMPCPCCNRRENLEDRWTPAASGEDTESDEYRKGGMYDHDR